MNKEVKFSNFLDLTEEFELNGKSKIGKLNLLKLNEYKDILKAVRDINNNIYILIYTSA